MSTTATSAPTEGARRHLGGPARLLPEALLVVEPNGRILEANKPAGTALGSTGVMLAGRQLQSFVDAGTRDSLQAFLHQCLRSGRLIPGSLQLVGGEGGARDVRCEGARLGGDEPLILLRLSTRESATNRFRLLTEKISQLAAEVRQRRHAESLLESQLTVLQLIGQAAPLEQILDALVGLAETHGSKGLYASVLLMSEDGKHLEHGAAPSLPAAYNEAIDGVEIGPEVGACGSAAFLNQPVVCADIATDPRWRDFKTLALAHGLRSCWSTPVPSPSGKVLGTFALYYREPREPSPVDRQVVVIASGIASIAIERRREEGQVRKFLASERVARAEAEAANRAKDEFLALVSHELRNPLNAMLGWTRLLRMGDLDDDTRRQGMETIERNAELQGQLIADVLDFARVSSGQLKLDLQTTRVAEIVEEAVDSALPDAEAAGVRVDLHAASTEPTRADPGRLHQVITNLLGNAIKFTPAGGRIGVEVEDAGGVARITVTDTGQGIEPVSLPYIFEPFRQADGSLARSHSGLGLGLAVVRHIVELHGGSVSAHSDGPGRGATFVVELPLQRVTESPEDDAEPKRPTDVGGLRVLVVDDEADARDMLATVLRHGGARPTLAASSAEATALMDAAAEGGERFDVLVSDIAMPGADGYELMRRVRGRSDVHAGIPAAALTAHARDADRGRAFDAGYDRHLPKPVDLEALLGVIAELAGRDSARRTG